MQKIFNLDRSVFYFINKDFSDSFFDPIMLCLSSVYFWSGILVFVLIWGVFSHGYRFLKIPLILCLLMGITDLVNFRIIKLNVKRYRPCHEISNSRLVVESCGGDFGFPSNHAANGMALAVGVGLFYRRKKLGLLFGFFAFFIGYSRVYVGVHYPLDVLCGFLVGVLCACLFYFFLRLLIKDAFNVVSGKDIK